MSEATTPPETRMREAEHLTDRYVALWNEPDAEARGHVELEALTATSYEQWDGRIRRES